MILIYLYLSLAKVINKETNTIDREDINILYTRVYANAILRISLTGDISICKRLANGVAKVLTLDKRYLSRKQPHFRLWQENKRTIKDYRWISLLSLDLIRGYIIYTRIILIIISIQCNTLIILSYL